MTPPQRNRLYRPAAAGEVLTAVTGRIGIHERLAQQRVWLLWEGVVGTQTAAHARPVRVRDSVLEVRVDHPVWMQQLQLLKPQLLQRLNAALAPETAIHDIHWRHGQPPPVALPPATPPEVHDRPLSSEQQQHLDDLLPADNSDLHASWRQLLRRHLLSQA